MRACVRCVRVLGCVLFLFSFSSLFFFLRPKLRSQRYGEFVLSNASRVFVINRKKAMHEVTKTSRGKHRLKKKLFRASEIRSNGRTVD